MLLIIVLLLVPGLGLRLADNNEPVLDKLSDFFLLERPGFWLLIRTRLILLVFLVPGLVLGLVVVVSVVAGVGPAVIILTCAIPTVSVATSPIVVISVVVAGLLVGLFAFFGGLFGCGLDICVGFLEGCLLVWCLS